MIKTFSSSIQRGSCLTLFLNKNRCIFCDAERIREMLALFLECEVLFRPLKCIVCKTWVVRAGVGRYFQCTMIRNLCLRLSLSLSVCLYVSLLLSLFIYLPLSLLHTHTQIDKTQRLLTIGPPRLLANWDTHPRRVLRYVYA